MINRWSADTVYITYAGTAAVEEAKGVLRRPWLGLRYTLEAGPAPGIRKHPRSLCLGRLCRGRLGMGWLAPTPGRHGFGFLITVEPKRIIHAIPTWTGPLIHLRYGVILGCTSTLRAYLGFVGGVAPFGAQSASLGGKNLVKLGRALSTLAAVSFTKSGCHCCIWVIFSEGGGPRSKKEGILEEMNMDVIL